MEFQERGAIHFHLFTTNFYPKEWVARSWYEICGTDDTRHLHAGTRIEKIRSGRHGISAYASKYAAKQSQKVIPEKFGWSGRFWGVAGIRMRTSADVFLTPEDVYAGAVRRRVIALENLLNQEISAGNIRDVSKEGCPAKVFYCKSPWLPAVLRVMIMRIAMSASMYSRVSAWDWHEFSDDWGRLEENDFEKSTINA